MGSLTGVVQDLVADVFGVVVGVRIVTGTPRSWRCSFSIWNRKESDSKIKPKMRRGRMLYLMIGHRDL